ncbi:glycosyltransferase family A protein [Nitratireductor sp. ZSWI3]|uniref:glycosyltransferase family 2 protein n=1 Tax=Nitratireductor sp. ZSWI3 TaxID=2966359 RepID=UPI00214FE4FA|nr:glycosyltransferase family A protein [Nitratireductor sp. ZSWI3]MCR4265118.1 glycosyltransferase family 2 protein [Nitratireductor sp. ZSWI3]
MKTQEYEINFQSFYAEKTWPKLSVVVPLYNYESYIIETLDSLRDQTLANFGLVVVNDCSSDDSASVVSGWLEENGERFEAAVLASNTRNAGLSITRNTGIHIAESEFIFFLDADNVIYPRCLERLQEALLSSDAVFAYSILNVFGADTGLMGTEAFSRERLKIGNYIDAMALIRRRTLLQHEGYHDLKHGWEDYDLWLRFCENDEYGIQVPEILGGYRVHAKSMLRTVTSEKKNHIELRKLITQRHSWLEI